ncbi:MAG: sortase [bacterium]|nr:sortase [bacterium]
MHINVSNFKFGNTPHYSINGILAQGFIKRLEAVKSRGGLARTLLVFSIILFLFVVVATSGRSYAARASYFFETARSIPALKSIMGSKNPSSAGLLPISRFVETGGDELAHLSQTLSIPKLHVSAPIVETSRDLKILDKDLESGVVRWPADAKAGGEEGAMILLGHSSAPMTYKGTYGSVFALLDKLEKGDRISVSGRETRTYRVVERLIINPKTYKEDFQGLAGDNLVLVSCWPVGSRLQRIAVRAERIFIEN